MVDSMDQLRVDNSHILSMKKGDLNLIHTRTQMCTLYRDDKFLVVKEFDCLDTSIYNMKIHEANVMLNYRFHPNLVNILSVWKSSATNSFSYKKIFMLFEHCPYGNMHDFIFIRFNQFPKVRILKYLTDISKGLSFLHHNDCVHGGIRIKNIIINKKNDCVLGPIKKCELESMRKTRQLLSAFSLDRNVRDYFIYWAPELLIDQGLTKASDIWSLGVVIFMMSTGQLPFTINKKDSIFNAIVGGNIRWNLLDGQPKIKKLLKNILIVDPRKRYNADDVFHHFQNEMVIVIQRFSRRSRDKILNQARTRAVVMIQTHMRRNLSYRRVQKIKSDKRNQAAVRIQKMFRNYQSSKEYRHLRKAVTFMQAQVLGRQTKRSYLKLKADVTLVQSYIRKRLCYNSFQCVSMQRLGIVKDLAGVKGNFTDINKMAGLYFRNFNNDPDSNLEANYANNLTAENENNQVLNQKTFNKFGEGNTQVISEEHAKLQERLGPKYDEFQ